MKVDFQSGLFSITAETKEENQKLFELINGGEMDVVTKRKYTKHTVEGEKRTYRKKRKEVECPVEGCEKLTKNLANHMLMSHGVDKDGNASHKVNMHGSVGLVGKPVVKLPDGTFKLAKKAGLLA